jgi:hypothetical protein
MSISNIFANGVLIDVNISGWTGEKQLTAEDLGIDKDKIPASFKLGKKALVPRTILDKFAHLDYMARRLLMTKSFTFPFGSARFLPKKAFDEFNTEFTVLQTNYQACVDDLINNYVNYKLSMREEFLIAAKEAYQRITKINGVELIVTDDGAQMTEDQFINAFLERIEKVYPKPETLRRKFGMDYAAFQMELPDLTEATIDDVAEENEKRNLLTEAFQKKMAKQMVAYAETLVKEPRERTNAVIEKIIDNLKNGKRFDVRTVDMISNMIKEFKTLNIVGDFNLESTLTWFKETYLDKYTPKQIKESDQIKADMLRDILGIQVMINDASQIQALAEAYRSKINL